MRKLVLKSFVFLIGSMLFPSLVFAQQVKLPAVEHRQEHSLSCEVATLKMALSVHGIQVSESELISKLPFDPTPKSNGVWGDPNQGFVGSINGRMLVNGYGVYWEPIAQVGKTYASTEILEHGSASQLARHIKAGNPVIIWGSYGRQARGLTWHTPQGKTISAVDGEHTRLVYGFDGSVDSPTRFYVIDPATGKFSWSTEELMNNWSSLGHMAVVVSPKRQWVREVGDSKIWELDAASNTRRWVISWQAFVSRGGSAKAVSVIAHEKLLRYTVGSSIK